MFCLVPHSSNSNSVIGAVFVHTNQASTLIGWVTRQLERAALAIINIDNCVTSWRHCTELDKYGIVIGQLHLN